MRSARIYIILFLLSGSVSANTKTLNNNVVIEQNSSAHVIIKSVVISETDEGVLISGRLKQRYGTNSRRLPGHIDIDILNSRGVVIYKVKTTYSNISLLKANRNFKYDYSVNIPFLLTEENTLRLSFHKKG